MKHEIEFPDNLEAWKTHKSAGEWRKVKRNEWYLGANGKAEQWTCSEQSECHYHILTPCVKKYVSVGWTNKYDNGEWGAIYQTPQTAANKAGRGVIATVEVFEEVEE